MYGDDEDSRQERWYRKNREEVLRRQRERYANDPELRAFRIEQNRQWRIRRRLEREKEMALLQGAGLPAQRVRRPMRPRKMEVESKGKAVEVWMYTTGALAQGLNRSSQSVRLWEKQGVLPEAMYRDDRGRRLYTRHQVAAILYVFEQNRGENAFSWQESAIPGQIREWWNRMPEGVWTETEPPPWRALEEDDGEA